MSIFESIVTFIVLLVTIIVSILPALSGCCCFVSFMVADNKKWAYIWMVIFLVSGPALIYCKGNQIDPIKITNEYFHPAPKQIQVEQP